MQMVWILTYNKVDLPFYKAEAENVCAISCLQSINNTVLYSPTYVIVCE